MDDTPINILIDSLSSHLMTHSYDFHECPLIMHNDLPGTSKDISSSPISNIPLRQNSPVATGAIDDVEVLAFRTPKT